MCLTTTVMAHDCTETVCCCQQNMHLLWWVCWWSNLQMTHSQARTCISASTCYVCCEWSVKTKGALARQHVSMLNIQCPSRISDSQGAESGPTSDRASSRGSLPWTELAVATDATDTAELLRIQTATLSHVLFGPHNVLSIHRSRYSLIWL